MTQVSGEYANTFTEPIPAYYVCSMLTKEEGWFEGLKGSPELNERYVSIMLCVQSLDARKTKPCITDCNHALLQGFVMHL